MIDIKNLTIETAHEALKKGDYTVADLCSAYLDVFRLPVLHSAFSQLYRARFGEEPTLPVVTLATGGGDAGAPS